MDETTRFPFDLETLNKGDVIPADRLEQAVGAVRSDPKYGLKVVNIGKRIERQLAKRGRILTIRRIGHDLKVLTDEEASPYNHRASRSGRRRQRRSFTKLAAVDVTQLPTDEGPKHERYVLHDSLYLQALNSATRAIATRAVVRTVPGLPPSERHPVRETAGMRDGDIMPINERPIQAADGPSARAASF